VDGVRNTANAMKNRILDSGFKVTSAVGVTVKSVVGEKLSDR